MQQHASRGLLSPSQTWLRITYPVLCHINLQPPTEDGLTRAPDLSCSGPGLTTARLHLMQPQHGLITCR